MEGLEITAKTVEQAIEEAEKRLGISRDQFEIEVVREGKSGVLGVRGKEVVIRVNRLTPPVVL